MRASSSRWRRRSLVAVRRREAGMDAPRKRLAQMDPFYLEVVPHLGKRVTVGRRGDSLYKGIVPDGGQRARAWGSGAGEWTTVRLGRRRLPLSTRQRANGRPGEISMCTCTSTRTDISALACTTENAAEISAAWNLPQSVEIQLNRWFHYTRARLPEARRSRPALGRRLPQSNPASEKLRQRFAPRTRWS